MTLAVHSATQFAALPHAALHSSATDHSCDFLEEDGLVFAPDLELLSADNDDAPIAGENVSKKIAETFTAILKEQPLQSPEPSAATPAVPNPFASILLRQPEPEPVVQLVAPQLAISVSAPSHATFLSPWKAEAHMMPAQTPQVPRAVAPQPLAMQAAAPSMGDIYEYHPSPNGGEQFDLDAFDATRDMLHMHVGRLLFGLQQHGRACLLLFSNGDRITISHPHGAIQDLKIHQAWVTYRGAGGGFSCIKVNRAFSYLASH
jgi:hypothetical protein